MKDDWNKFVKERAGYPVQWWLDHYETELAIRGGLTAREWDHYERIKKLASKK